MVVGKKATEMTSAPSTVSHQPLVVLGRYGRTVRSQSIIVMPETRDNLA